MKQSIKISKLLMVLFLAVGCAHADLQAGDVHRDTDRGGWVQEIKGSLQAGRTLRVHSVVGSIDVQGGIGSRVEFTIRKHAYRGSEEDARRRFSAFRVSASMRGDEVVLNGEYGEGSMHDLSAEFIVTLPRDTDWVRLDTMGGSVNVRNIGGRVQAETAGGSISLEDIGGDTRANTMGGSVRVNNIGGDAHLETAGGSIDIGDVKGVLRANTSGGSVHLTNARKNATVETAGGSITVTQCGGELRASTAGGSIEIGDVGGPAILETAGGGIRLGSAKGAVRASTAGGGIYLDRLTTGVNAETMAGPIHAEFISSHLTESHLTTTMGDIIVYLPADAAVTIHAAIEMANGHRIHSDFPLEMKREGGDWGPGEIYADGNINGGGAVLKVHTTNGNIEFRKGTKK